MRVASFTTTKAQHMNITIDDDSNDAINIIAAALSMYFNDYSDEAIAIIDDKLIEFSLDDDMIAIHKNRERDQYQRAVNQSTTHKLIAVNVADVNVVNELIKQREQITR